MHYDQVTSMVNHALGNIGGMETKIRDTLEYVKEVELERNPAMRPWFLKETRTVAVVAEAIQFTLPAGFLAEDPMGFIRWEGDKDYYKKLMKFQEAEVSETCLKTFLLKGSVILLNNPVSIAGNFEVHAFWKSLPFRDGMTDNPWLLYGADLLIAAAAQKIAIDSGDNDTATVQVAVRAKAESRILAENIERDMGELM